MTVDNDTVTQHLPVKLETLCSLKYTANRLQYFRAKTEFLFQPEFTAPRCPTPRSDSFLVDGRGLQALASCLINARPLPANPLPVATTTEMGSECPFRCSLGCVLLLNQIYLTTMYRSTIPLRFI